MGLFLDGIFDEGSGTSPSTVLLHIPDKINEKGSVTGYRDIKGLLISQPTLRAQNKWGPVIDDISALTTWASLMGNNQLPTWIGASVQCWKGTDPLRFSLDFYLINYKRGLQLEDKIKSLVQLASLTQASGTITSVYAHKGYASHIFRPNSSFFSNSNVNKLEELQNNINLTGLASADKSPGTVSVQIGDRIKVSNLLVTQVDVTASLVEVPDKLPLYYRISVGFTGVQPLLNTDVAGIF